MYTYRYMYVCVCVYICRWIDNKRSYSDVKLRRSIFLVNWF